MTLMTPQRHLQQVLLQYLKLFSAGLSAHGGQRRQMFKQFVMKYSHISAVNNNKVVLNFSRCGLHCCGWNKYRYKVCNLPCTKSLTRGFVTPASDNNIAREMPPVVDKRGQNFCDETWQTQDNDNVEEDNDSNNEKLQGDSSQKPCHIPVMVEEVLNLLQPKNGQTIVDMTFGAGGHAREILRLAPDVCYIASDRDPFANSLAVKLAAECQGQVNPVLSRFSEIPVHLHQLGIKPGTVDAFLFDLGASSMQFDMAERGFALSRDGPLDMRMDGDRFPDSPTAADVVNCLDPHDLAHILKKYGEESSATQIAHAIVEARYAFGNFTRTKQLADIISAAFSSGSARRDKMSRHAHLATKSFQAIRIFVNNELNEIHNGLQVARHYLKPYGCCVVISFHSLEDRIVKRHFLDIDIDQASNLSIHDHFRNANVSFDVEMVKETYMSKLWQPVSRKVIESSQDESLRNPRSRSAKLRAALKVEES